VAQSHVSIAHLLLTKVDYSALFKLKAFRDAGASLNALDGKDEPPVHRAAVCERLQKVGFLEGLISIELF
jgi:hypothetical protein